MDEEKETSQIANPRWVERSASKAAYDAAMAFGAATGGAGTLAGGVAAVKVAFGKKKQPKKD